jgi:serine/threonine protein kinase
MAAVLNIARAIRHLHSLGIVYRDLKPDNIGFDFSGELKVRTLKTEAGSFRAHLVPPACLKLVELPINPAADF